MSMIPKTLSKFNINPAILVFFIATIVHLVMIGQEFWKNDYIEEPYDEPRYIYYAEEIRAGRGLHAPGYDDKPTAYVMPAIPVMFALIGPDNLVRLRIVQLILCSLVAVATFYIGRHIGGGNPVVGWLAVFFLLANLAWVIQPGYLLTEPLYTLTLLVSVGLLLYRPDDIRFLVGVGIGLGIAWLTRGALIGSLALIFLYLWWRVGFWKTVITGMVMLVTISPWIVRNYFAFDTFVATSTQSGNVLAGAYNDEVYKQPWGDGWINPDELFLPHISQELFNDEIAYSNYQVEQGRKWILDNPEKLPKLFAAHVFGFVRPWPKVARNDVEFLYEISSWVVAMGLLIYGAWYTISARNEKLAVVWIVILGGFLTGIIFFAIPRYRLPYSPYFALIEAAAAWQLWLHLPKSQSRLGNYLSKRLFTREAASE